MTEYDETPMLDMDKLSNEALSRIYAADSGRVSTQVLTTIADIDAYISAIKTEMEWLNGLKSSLLTIAIRDNITEDKGAMLIAIPDKKMRNPITDNKKFSKEFPQAYHMIRTQQMQKEIMRRENFTKNLDDMEIPLMLADNTVGKEIVTEFVGYKPQTMTFEVRKKHITISNTN